MESSQSGHIYERKSNFELVDYTLSTSVSMVSCEFLSTSILSYDPVNAICCDKLCHSLDRGGEQY